MTAGRNRTRIFRALPGVRTIAVQFLLAGALAGLPGLPRLPLPLLPTPLPAPAAVPPVPSAPPALGPGYGFDISWPQCNKPYPSGPFDIAVVGVTGGRPLTTNPCLGSEGLWLAGAKGQQSPRLYVNLALGSAATGRRDCPSTDDQCHAYNYGALTVGHAMAYAASKRILASSWWLDVEKSNAWSDEHLDWNAAIVRGAVDEFAAQGISVGVYSTARQWQMIVGGYRPRLNAWVATTTDAASAPAACDQSKSFTAGPVVMVQYPGATYDEDYRCPVAPLTGDDTLAPSLFDLLGRPQLAR